MKYTKIISDLFNQDINEDQSVFWNCCPFHKEKTPSWNINLDSGLWHCFGCHESGNLIKLLKELKGLTFAEAKEIIGKNQIFYNSNQLVLTDFEKSNLIKPIEKKEFKGIQLPDDFKKIKTHSYLLKRGLTEEEIIKDGWGISNQYLNRVILPIRMNGVLYNYLARDITGKSNRKVKNAIGGKTSLCLIGIDNVKSKELIYITEGYFDFILLRRMGYPVVALGWNKISKEQAELLSQFRKIIFIPDNDQGGQFLLKEAMKLMGNCEVNFVEIPNHRKDPGECTHREIFYSIKQKSYPLSKWVAHNYYSF